MVNEISFIKISVPFLWKHVRPQNRLSIWICILTERGKTIFFGVVTYVHLVEEKIEIPKELDEPLRKFPDLGIKLMCLCLTWGELGAEEKVHVLFLSVDTAEPCQISNLVPVKAKQERKEDGKAASVLCEWPVPVLLMPHMYHYWCHCPGCTKSKQTFPHPALNISAKGLQIPRELSLWIQCRSRVRSKSPLKHKARSLRLYFVPAAFSDRVDPIKERKEEKQGWIKAPPAVVLHLQQAMPRKYLWLLLGS